ncbi:MAG: YidC/Oxa1 family membrane protein insertase [Bacillota bacterium]
MTWLTSVMQQGMNVFYGWTGSYGLAIIFLTLAIRLLLAPFQYTQVRSAQKMMMLEPLRKAIEKKYKNDPQKVNQETMELWRKNKVNPLGGCLPLLLQFPFIIALFRALDRFQYLGPAGFLWIPHLARPDTLFILPVLTGITTWWQQKISTPATDQSQKTMLFAMPIVIAFLSLRFAAGLALYWVVSNLLAIAQQYLTPKPLLVKGEGTNK